MKKKTVKILVIVLSSIAALVLLVGVCSYTCVNYIIDSAKNMQIVIEEMDTGIKKQATREGMNIYPQFSNSNDHLYFINRPSGDDKHQKNRLLVYSVKEMKTINSISIPDENLTPTSSVFNDSRVLCFLKNDPGQDIVVYAIRDGKTTRLTGDTNKKSEARFSPDGKWVSYIEVDAKTSRSNLCVVPSAGGKPIRLSDSNGFLADVKIHSWSADSKSVCYLDFITLVVRSLNGGIVNKIDLTGLTNFKTLMTDSRNPDRIYLIARE